MGANGTGKTRLAVYIEEKLGKQAHRIAAHRALVLNPNVNKVPEAYAKIRLNILGEVNSTDLSMLNYDNRKALRWKRNSATHLLNDFDALLQYLFAQQMPHLSPMYI